MGILLDTDTTSYYDFLDPTLGKFSPAAGILWLKAGGRTPSRIAVPGDVGDFFWSSDSLSLSVMYVADDNPPSIKRRDKTSIGIVDVRAREFRTLAKSYPRAGDQPGRYFIGGEWIPNEQRVVVRRITEEDPWVSEYFPDWGVAEVTGAFSESEMSWHAAEVADHAHVFPVDASNIFAETTLNGVRSPFALTTNGTKPAEVVNGLDGSSSLVALSTNFSRAAFVNESLTRPPEIYIRLNGNQSATPLARLNASIAQKVASKVRDVVGRNPRAMTCARSSKTQK